MLCNMTMTLHLNVHTLDPIALDNRIGQGDPLSMALYQYYNMDILDIPRRPCKLVEAYVDFAILIATATTLAEAHNIFADMMVR
ncbi:hypothetical protein EI94DRAFT_1542368, partial [Lactarius quietus]